MAMGSGGKGLYTCNIARTRPKNFSPVRSPPGDRFAPRLSAFAALSMWEAPVEVRSRSPGVLNQ
jgi:hypothetical protein